MKIKISKNDTLKISTLLFWIIALHSQVSGQPKNTWYQFRDKKTDLVGYKDAQGRIKIPTKFGEFTGSLVFNDIIAVYEEKTKQSYYLLKNGKKVGLDSLYIWDYMYDNEKENKIRFRDKKTDKVGFFNKDGKIIIPAIYNDALSFHNGLALVVYNGKRVCFDKICEHWSWRDINAIIDSHNKIIADSININEIDKIDWFALKITNSKPDTTLYTSFKTPTDKFYSFLNREKEFTAWFYKKYLPNLNYQELSTNCYKELVIEDNFNKNGRTYYSKASFIKRYHTLMLQKMKNIKLNKVETHIFKEDINEYIYTRKNFSVFYTRDGELNNEKHPGFNVVITCLTKNKKVDYQDQFSFIWVNNGYKLIEISLGVGLNS